MICLKCGYCCHVPWVLVVDDPEKGIDKANWVWYLGKSRCKHLQGKRPGDFVCGIHDKEWYAHTPCATHGLGKHVEGEVCSRGQKIMKIFEEGKDKDWSYKDFVEAVKDELPLKNEVNQKRG